MQYIDKLAVEFILANYSLGIRTTQLLCNYLG